MLKRVRSTTDRVEGDGGRKLRSLHEGGELEGVDGATAATGWGPGKLKVADGVRIVKDSTEVLNKLGQC